jgi:hypothetical protein
MFRDSTRYLDRYFGQVDALREALAAFDAHLQLIFVEGDSNDDTWDQLHRRTKYVDAVILKRAHGKLHAWHSVDIPERWKAISWVCNGILEHVESNGNLDALIYVESDLGWTAETMLTLLGHLGPEHPAVSPMCFTAVNDFYDVWGHIKDGVQFGPFPPYHHGLGPGLTEVDSTGSCIVMLGSVARSGIRYSEVDHCRGLGRDIRAKGFSLWVDPTIRVVHY